MKMLAIAAFALIGAPAFAQDSATLTVANSPEHGDYIADGEGKALYMFEADTQGAAGGTAMSACKDDCTAAWPPLTTSADAQAGEGVSADMVGTITRDDGAMQVTYNGWPLYHFATDQAPGDTNGQDVEGFGAEWYLVAPSGEMVHD